MEALTLAQNYVRNYSEEVTEESDLTGSQKRKKQRLGEDPEPSTTETRTITPYSNPKFWAAFILLDALN